MKWINDFKIFEADEIQNDSPKRSERLLSQAQKESKNDPKGSGPKPSMVFTDVVGSSKMWSDDPITMFQQLKGHHKLVQELSEKYNGWIVKTIGDAFMVYFESDNNSLLNAIKFSKQLILTEKAYNLRVGVCEGYMDQQTYRIQKVDLKDFFGNTVNVASRMESKVAESGGCIAFSSVDGINENKLSLIKNSTSKELEQVDLSKYDLRGATIKKAYRVRIK